MFSPHKFENTHSVKVRLHATSGQSLHLKSCSIKYFLRYMFLKNAPLSHLQAIVLCSESHV